MLRGIQRAPLTNDLMPEESGPLFGKYRYACKIDTPYMLYRERESSGLRRGGLRSVNVNRNAPC